MTGIHRTISQDNLLFGTFGIDEIHLFHGLQGRVTIDQPSECHQRLVEGWHFPESDGELGAVGVWTAVGQGENASVLMRHRKGFV
jgi:hypothetical protein